MRYMIVLFFSIFYNSNSLFSYSFQTIPSSSTNKPHWYILGNSRQEQEQQAETKKKIAELVNSIKMPNQIEAQQKFKEMCLDTCLFLVDVRVTRQGFKNGKPTNYETTERHSVTISQFWEQVISRRDLSREMKYDAYTSATKTGWIQFYRFSSKNIPYETSLSITFEGNSSAIKIERICGTRGV